MALSSMNSLSRRTLCSVASPSLSTSSSSSAMEAVSSRFQLSCPCRSRAADGAQRTARSEVQREHAARHPHTHRLVEAQGGLVRLPAVEVQALGAHRSGLLATGGEENPPHTMPPGGRRDAEVVYVRHDTPDQESQRPRPVRRNSPQGRYPANRGSSWAAARRGSRASGAPPARPPGSQPRWPGGR